MRPIIYIPFLIAALVGGILGRTFGLGDWREPMQGLLLGALIGPVVLALILAAAFAFGLGRGLRRLDK